MLCRSQQRPVFRGGEVIQFQLLLAYRQQPVIHLPQELGLAQAVVKNVRLALVQAQASAGKYGVVCPRPGRERGQCRPGRGLRAGRFAAGQRHLKLLQSPLIHPQRARQQLPVVVAFHRIRHILDQRQHLLRHRRLGLGILQV